MRILIAEDDLTSRSILSALLKKTGHTVIETTNCADALDALQQPNAPRMAILDWMMPEMDVLTVIRKVRERQTDQPQHLS